MSLETVTKKEWNNVYHEGMDSAALNVLEAIQQYSVMVKVYEKYRTEIRTHRITHQVDYDKGTLNYKLGTKRKIGFKK